MVRNIIFELKSYIPKTLKVNFLLSRLLPGRYGSILKFSNNSVVVNCIGYRNLCNDMCLSVNITQSSVGKPFIPTVEACANVNSVLCVSRANSVVHKVGCSTRDYYRVGYSTNNTSCYSIKVLSEPLSIEDLDGSQMVIQLSCEGNKIFDIDNLEAHIIYRQLALATKLGKQERCLFGILSLNTIIKQYEWNQIDYDAITFTNWDKSVDFSPVFPEDRYLTVNSDGKWRWEKNATCIICAMDDTPFPSKLMLWFDNRNSELILKVTNQEYLWKEKNSKMGFLCFANIAKNYTEVPVICTGQSGSYLLTNVGAGEYWCSGHLIQTIDLVKSNDVYAFGMVFSVYVEYHCEEVCTEPFDHTDKLEYFLSSLIDEDLMKIKDMKYIDHDTDYTDQDVKIVFHVTLSVEEEILHDNEHNGIGLSEDQLYTYYALKKLNSLHKGDVLFDILSVTSTKFCLPDSILSPDVLNWKAAKVGETVELLIECFNFTRKCSSNESTTAAVWDDYTIQFTCNNQTETSRSLIDLHDSFRSSRQTPEVISNLSTTLHNVTLNEVDVFLVSELFEKITNFVLSDQVCLSYCDLKNVFEIFNSLMLIPKDVAVASSQLNSTNSLLASFDEILIHQANNTLTHHESFPGVVMAIKSSLVANYILDPVVSSFSGIAFLKNNATENRDFLSYSVRFLQPNQSIETLLKDENLILASFVPQKLIETWKSPKIIFTLFFNDILFQSQKHQELSSDGSIISLTILNSDSKLSSSIPFIFKPNISLSHQSSYMPAQFCGYWSFISEIGWESTGCILNELSLQISDTILCECSHLTHFGNLVNTDILFDELNEKVLNLITLAGCALSLVGIIGIFLTAVVFRSWRNKSSSKFLLQLSAAIALQMILLIFINSDDDILVTISGNVYGCIATGALIHYSILVMFFWMLIIAYLQFIRYVIVFNQIATANFLLKSSIFGWGMPMLPVFIVVAVDPTSYIPSSSVKFCYPGGYGLLFGLLIPIFLIVLANIFVFIAVVISLIKGSSKSSACKINEKNEAIWSQLRLSVFLFFILGLSWIFGFLSDRSILLSYLFCLTATLQGFVLFLYFVILDPVARNLWKQLFMKICGIKRQSSS